MKVLYGSSTDRASDVTRTIIGLCDGANLGQRWRLPDDDVARAAILGDPQVGVLKKVYVVCSGGFSEATCLEIQSWESVDFFIHEGRLNYSCGDKKRQAVSVLKSRYYRACEVKGDISQHVPLLLGYAIQCISVVECGVRDVVSSYAFAMALQGVKGACYTLIDPYKSANIDEFIAICQNAGIDAKFINDSDLTCPLVETDLLFFGTWHVYAQLSRDLKRLASFVSKFIIVHGTTVNGLHGESLRNGANIVKQSLDNDFPEEETSQGLWPAIEEFLNGSSDWILDLQLENNNGITILRRV